MFNRIKADVIVGRLLENFEKLKQAYPNEPFQVYWGLFFIILRPIKPFNSYIGEDIQYIIDKLLSLNNLEKGFEFLCLLVHKVIKSKVYDINKVKEAVSEYVAQVSKE